MASAAGNAFSRKAIVPINHVAAYELVVDQIKRAIYLGRYLPGEKLPPERDLADQLGVSRTTVREAVRMLEGKGLLTVRRGATGGLIVTRPHVDSANELRSLIRSRKKELADIFDYRLATEGSAARLAAERRSKTDLKSLEAALDRMAAFVANQEEAYASRTIAGFNSADAEFHIGIAQATQNPHLVRAVEEARAAMFLPVGAIFSRLRDDANADHDVILSTIRDGDGDRAEASMRRHIERTREEMDAFLRSR